MATENNSEKSRPANLMERIDRFIAWAVGILLRILRQGGNTALAASLTSFIKFGLVGVTNTLVSYCLNAATLLLLARYNVSWDYVAANMTAFILSVLWSFYWNNKYVFTAGDGEERNIWKALGKTYVSYAFTGILMTNVLSYFFINKLGISKFLSPLLILVISVPVNYIINKNWAFKTKKKQAPQ